MLTRERVLELLSFDPDEGAFYWKASHASVAAGSRAGSIHSRNGYRIIKLDGRRYREHLLVWLMLHNEWCPRLIDHIDRNRANNRPSNLRRATESQQRQNAAIRSDNALGIRGVHRHPLCEKFQAEVCKDGRRYYLGLFDTPEQAGEAAQAKRLELFGSYAPAYDHMEAA